MPDKAYREDEKQLREMEKKLTEMYTRASKELTKEFAEYADKTFARKVDLLKAIDNAKTPEEKKQAQEHYQGYLKQVTIQSSRYQDLIDQYAHQISKVNETAAKYINDQVAEIYCRNYNSAGEALTRNTGISFSLVNENVIKELATKDETLLPYKHIDGRKDVRWNTQKVNSEILQGILKGESIRKIQKRLSNVTEMNKNSAYRNARTAVTSAENKGRMDMLKNAEGKGVISHKIWQSAHDGHTREAHLQLDGQEQEREEPFSSILGDIMYPGDPDADPANVYNCRCTLIYKVVGFKKPEKAETELAKPQEEPEQKGPFENETLKDAMPKKDYKEFSKLIENAETRPLFDQYYTDDVKVIKGRSGSQWIAETKTLKYDTSYESYGMNRYGTFAHESGHMFNTKMEGIQGLHFTEIEAIAKENPGSLRKFISDTPAKSDEFLSAMRKDLVGKTSEQVEQICKELKSMDNSNLSSGFQDAMDGLYSTQKTGQLGWGHGDRYYNRMFDRVLTNPTSLIDIYKDNGMIDKNLGRDESINEARRISRQYDTANELWANITSALTVGGEERATMEKYCPNTVETYRNIIKSVGKKE